MTTSGEKPNVKSLGTVGGQQGLDREVSRGGVWRTSESVEGGK